MIELGSGAATTVDQANAMPRQDIALRMITPSDALTLDSLFSPSSVAIVFCVVFAD